MTTKEELLKLPVEELADKVLELEKSNRFWTNEYHTATEKFGLYKSAIKSVVLFMEN